MKGLLSSLFKAFGQDWWIKVDTGNPVCTYYFGPYSEKSEAESEVSGFLDDLRGEGAVILSTEIKRDNPQEFTIYDEGQDYRGVTQQPVLSGQP